MDNDEKMKNLWTIFDNARSALDRAMVSEYNGMPSEWPAREDVVFILRDLRDARRDFMKAAGECDDAWINDDEAQVLREAETFSAIVSGHYNISDKEIEAADPAFRRSTGGVTATPRFPTRFDA